MSATIWCRLANGTEHKDLHPTESAAVQALAKTLETHRSKGRTISEQQLSASAQRSKYVVKDADGQFVAMYQVLD